MNENTNNLEPLSPELAALDAGLAELGAAERAAAPANLEGRIIAATAGTFKPRITHAPVATRQARPGVLGRLSVKRLDWPMRVAAVIVVMIGGWTVFHGVTDPIAKPNIGPIVAKNPPSAAEADRLLNILSTLDKGGTSEKIQNLLLNAAKLQTMVEMGDDEFVMPDTSDPESL